MVFCREMKARGGDVVDCSSGGIGGSATINRMVRYPSFQAPLSDTIRPATHRLVRGVMLKAATRPELTSELTALGMLLVLVGVAAISRYRVTLD